MDAPGAVSHTDQVVANAGLLRDAVCTEADHDESATDLSVLAASVLFHCGCSGRHLAFRLDPGKPI
jgi:hypothetical protein